MGMVLQYYSILSQPPSLLGFGNITFSRKIKNNRNKAFPYVGPL
jgi:hypothetical protein